MSAPLSPAPIPPASAKKKSHPLGIVALFTAIVGFIFACIPGALIVGWFLLPIAFVLAIVAVCQKGTKTFGLVALILSVVGTIVGFAVFFGAAVSAVDDAFAGDDVTVSEPETLAEEEETDEEALEEAAEEEPALEEGTRENPFPIGTTVSNDEWEVTIDSVQLAANDAVLAASMINSAPDEGDEYILVGATATYIGGTSATPSIDLSFSYVTADGVTINSFDNYAVAPDSFDGLTELYSGASISGNHVFAVPSATAGDGTVTVRVGMFGDTVFYAAK